LLCRAYFVGIVACAFAVKVINEKIGFGKIGYFVIAFFCQRPSRNAVSVSIDSFREG